MHKALVAVVSLSFLVGACAQSSADPTGASAPAVESGTLPDLTLELFAEGFAAPVALEPIRDGSGRFLLADQVGLIWLLGPDGSVAAQPFLDLRERMRPIDPAYDERGLLGLALHPTFVETGLFYVFYTAPLRDGAPAGYDNTIHVSEFRRSEENPDVADPSSERVLIELDHPRYNHNGGGLAFGPDGYLYISFGDGGIQGDPDGNAQNLETLLGKIVRIDVDFGDPYGIPPDNPFVGTAGLDEIYAYGLRHPWRFSVDEELGLIVGDAGDQGYEEISLAPAGSNLGWNVREGFECYPPGSTEDCPSQDGTPLTDPVLVYDHSVGIAVIGGYVYRGAAIPELQSSYVFADWGLGQGTLFYATSSELGNPTWGYQRFYAGRDFILSLALDEQGEIYVLTNGTAGPSGNTGRVYKLISSP